MPADLSAILASGRHRIVFAHKQMKPCRRWLLVLDTECMHFLTCAFTRHASNIQWVSYGQEHLERMSKFAFPKTGLIKTGADCVLPVMLEPARAAQ